MQGKIIGVSQSVFLGVRMGSLTPMSSSWNCDVIYTNLLDFEPGTGFSSIFSSENDDIMLWGVFSIR